MLTVPSKFENKICVSAYVLKMGDKKYFKFLPKGFTSVKESYLSSSQGQDHLLVLTGKSNDIICFDVDDMEWFKDHEDIFKDSTYTEKSFSGKLHFYYKYNDLVKNAQQGTFDILSDNKTAMLGEPLNDLPFNEMTPEIIEYININLLHRTETNNHHELLNLMDDRYVKSGPNWRSMGRAFKLLGIDYDIWLSVSMKDSNGFDKNFNKDGFNCMESMWSDFLTKNELKEKIYDIQKQYKDYQKKSKFDDHIKKRWLMQLKTEFNELIPFMDIEDSFEFFACINWKTFLAKPIFNIAKKLDHTKMLDWLLVNDFISQNDHHIAFKNLNHFDLDDPFYFNDFQKLVTRKYFYTDGEMLSLCAENLYRVCSFADNLVIVKENEEKRHAIYDLSNFCDFYVNVPNLNKHGDPTHFIQYIKKYHSRIIADQKFPKVKINFDISYKEKDTFYACNRFLAIPGTQPSHRLEMFLSFIKEILCNGDEIVYNYLMAWFAFMWKYPYFKTGKALLLFGEEGIGKGTIVEFLCNFVFGKKNCLPNASYDDIMSHKNSNLLGKKLVCVNELSSSLGKRTTNQDKLKTMITEEQFEMNKMCKDKVTVDSSFDFIFMTNNECSLKIKPGDRRFFCVHCSDEKKEDIDFFTGLRKTCFNSECASEFVTHLETLLSSPEQFRMMKTPLTQLKESMIVNSEWDSEFYDALLSNEIDDLNYKEKVINNESFALFGRQQLMDIYTEWMKRNNYKPKVLAKFKKTLLEQDWISERKLGDHRYYAIPSEKLYSSLTLDK